MATNQAVNPILLQVERLKLLKELNLLSKGGDTFFDQMTELASRIIGTPISLLSMVSSDRQVFKSAHGLTGPVAEAGETPLSHSFCQHVVTTHKPLVVNDAREDDMLKDNLAVRDLNVIGYLGIPVTVLDGFTLGSFCAIDNQPREWTYVEIALMQELAQILTREIDLHAKTRLDPDNYREKLLNAQNKIERLLKRLNVDQPKEDILTQLRHLRDQIQI